MSEDKKKPEQKVPVFFEGGSFIITEKEKDLLDFIVQTGDIPEAAKRAGMTVEGAKDFLKSERIIKYLEQKVARIARRNDITLDSVLDRLHKIAWGKITVTKFEMDALKVLSKWLNIIKPPQTNIQNLTLEVNPMIEKTTAELSQMMKDRAIETTAENMNGQSKP